jgi:hypothetical protein
MSQQAAGYNAADDNLTVKTMSYQDLRRMTESAASYRGATVYIVIDDKNWDIVTEKPQDVPGRVVIPCNNDLGREPRTLPPVDEAIIRAKDTKPVDLLHLKDRHGNELGAADAVFWTAAAVEKFVVPYYASVYGDEAPGKLTRIISVLGSVREPAALEAELGGEPFALAHMPKSEYVQVEGTLAALVKTPTGAVTVLMDASPEKKREEG